MVMINRIMYDMLYRISKPRWDDGIIPTQVIQLASQKGNAGTALDLGCGTGTHSIYLAGQGFSVTAVDISPAAIDQAHEKAFLAGVTPEFIIHDATRLGFLSGPFDIVLDVGCFHGLGLAGQQRYALELNRLMVPGSTLLLWGMDLRQLGFGLSPKLVEKVFSPGFKLEQVDSSQLHTRPSKWYWLKRF